MSELVGMCVIAIGLLLDVEIATLERAEDFSDLSPPRVRVSVSYLPDTGPNEIAAMLNRVEGRSPSKPAPVRTGFYRCTFEGTDLVELCPPEGCLFQDKRRIEEIRALLKQPK